MPLPAEFSCALLVSHVLYMLHSHRSVPERNAVAFREQFTDTLRQLVCFVNPHEFSVMYAVYVANADIVCFIIAIAELVVVPVAVQHRVHNTVANGVARPQRCAVFVAVTTRCFSHSLFPCAFSFWCAFFRAAPCLAFDPHVPSLKNGAWEFHTPDRIHS